MRMLLHLLSLHLGFYRICYIQSQSLSVPSFCYPYSTHHICYPTQPSSHYIMKMECARCGKAVGDKDSVLTRTGRMLCYWCADIEKYYWNDEYYDDDRKRYKKDEDAGEDPWSF